MKWNWRETIESARKSLRGTPFVCLVFHFFTRFFSGDAVSAESDLRLGIGGILALLALPGAILPILLLPKYSSLIRWMTGQRHFDYNAASLPDKYMLLTLTMAVTGIVAVVKWDGLFPDRLDYANLAPLPAGARRIFLAKFIALLFFVGLFALVLNGVSTVLFPIIVMGDEGNGALWLRFGAAHLVSTVAGSFFMLFSLCALVGLLMTVLPHRRFRQISTPVQFVLVMALVMLLLFTPEIGSLVTNSQPGTRRLLGWLPTVWFLGLYQQIFGSADAEFQALAARAVEGLSVAIGLSVAVYAASYGRYFRSIPEMMESAASGPGLTKRFASRCVARFVLRNSFERACFDFAAKTLARSQRHRLLLAGYVGLGMAVAIQDVASDWRGTTRAQTHLPGAMLLSAPLAISFFLLSGLRFAFNVPAELSANWIFRVAPEQRGELARRVAKKLMLVFLAGVILATVAAYSAVWGARLGIEHSAFVLLASLLLTDTLLVGYRKIPFTCSYSAGKQNAGFALAAYFLLFLFFSSSLAYLEHRALGWPSVIPFVVLMALLGVCSVALRYYEREFAAVGEPLLFQDEPEPVVASMDLR